MLLAALGMVWVPYDTPTGSASRPGLLSWRWSADGVHLQTDPILDLARSVSTELRRGARCPWRRCRGLRGTKALRLRSP